jgi:hypothetical protein
VDQKESFIKYLAGLMDADGHLAFTFTRDERRPDFSSLGLTLSVGASSVIDKHGFVDSLVDLTGIGYVNRVGKYYKGVAKYSVWAVSKRAELEKILPRLIKHMVVKGQHWQWMLGIWRDIRSRPYGSRSLQTSEREVLIQAAKESRKLRVGPIKPKNHPSWAWLAGYLDGDGWYMHRNPKAKRYGMQVGASSHITDVSVLEFIQKAFGGTIRSHSQSENVRTWKRSLSNENRSFALHFLPNLVKHSRLKRHKIEIMIHHHQQRLSALGPKGQATV